MPACVAEFRLAGMESASLAPVKSLSTSPFGGDQEAVSAEIGTALGANALMQAAQRRAIALGAEVRDLPGH
jgi:hypothetical protein